MIEYVCPNCNYPDCPFLIDRRNCCETCRHFSIPHCRYGCRESTGSIICIDCEDPYYSGGGGQGCLVCPEINQCIDRHCTNENDTTCKKCNEDKVIFTRRNNDRECQRMCAHNNHYCWPGTCGTNGLTKDCQCAEGFIRRSIVNDSYLNAGETTCQPDKPPNILTCDTLAVGPNDEKKRAENAQGLASSNCDQLSYMYGNFQPVEMKFTMFSEFTVNISMYEAVRPKFVVEENFGISDTTVHVEVKTVSGSSTPISSHKQLLDSISSASINHQHEDTGSIIVNNAAYNLQNGQRLCLVFEANAGGFLRSNNIDGITSGPIPYTKKKKQRTVCYRYDDAPPKHCMDLGTCSIEPLSVTNRITRSAMSTAEFGGWMDPVPSGGLSDTASSIESYEITIKEVPPSNGTLKISTQSIFSSKVNSTTINMQLNLTSTSPRLYCITLDVKDVADNVRYARRFLLYDSSSYIETWKDKTFLFDSASPSTNFVWQTHHNTICLSWRDYFINVFYLHNNLLDPIEANEIITGMYEQSTGLLPVSGTPNVHGIIKYYVSWKVNDEDFNSEKLVPDFHNQSFCTWLNVSDGQTYTFNIHPVDIVNNTYNESRTLYIDRSHPHINNVWLNKDGYETLYVHNSTDLSIMRMTFDALDPHSGLSTINWVFGIADTSTELTKGHLVVNKINMTCPPDSSDCSCPKIGTCEFIHYSIPLNKLVSEDKNKGNHNRNYFFTITVTNNAMLSTTEHVVILVDESPPEEGVVFEGPVDFNDIDYTSDDSFIVLWHNFIDHESGINVYRIGLADICLTKKDFSEVNKSFTYRELPFQVTSVRLPANFTGKKFVTVVALNNAMEASNAVCSDGITRDMSASEIRNVTLQNAALSESIVCHKGRPHLLHSNLKKVPLNTMICSDLCNTTQETAIADYLPTLSAAGKDEEISNFLCRNRRLYTNETLVFLPTDHIVLEWDVEESGSQIEDFFVGFGLDATEKNSPSLVDYISTQRKPFFRRKHEGIGTNELFNIFIKTVNKAGLSSISTLGPILIDQTPPLYKNIPKVTFEESHIMFAWESNTFYDDEQIAQINQIIFQLGNDEKAVSPLLEWRLDSPSPCPPYSGGCIRYPISRLQNQDTGDGLQFHLNIHIYNNAGHFTSIKTEKFRLPSRYTPGKGIVFDIDPEETNTSTDIDIHFTENVLCACWIGFKHHENVSLEVGIGSNSTTADVVEFKSISSDINQFCFNSTSVVNIEVNFFLIRANCSGGSTISSSNGVKIYQRQTLESELRVKIGPNCLSNFEYRTNVSLNNYSNIAILPFSLSIGQRYALLSEGEGLENININGSDCTINKQANVYYLTPFTEKPILQIKHSYLTEQQLLLQVIRCPFESSQPISNQVNISWILTNLTNQGLLFSVGLFEVFKDNGSVMENEVVPFQTPVYANSYTFLYISLDEEISYHAKVRICNNVRCLRPIKSNIFTVDKEVPRISITSAELKVKAAGDCVQLTASWEFTADVKRIGFFQWSLSRDDKGSHLLSVWNTELSRGSSELKVEECIDLPDHGHVRTFLCVRVFLLSGLSSTNCRKTTKDDYESYTIETIYDFDTSKESWTQVQKMLLSSNIGQHYSLLHDSELNIGSANTTVAGALMYAFERPVAWYLMKTQNVPRNCENDLNCIVKYDTHSGYVEFNRKHISLNQIYYICAYSNTTEVHRELFTETLDEISSCSNGFVLDSSPPTKGEVKVQNHQGFVTNPQHVLVTWIGFDDNIDASVFGYPSKLRDFSIGIGTQSGSNGIAEVVRTGLESSAVISMQKLSDGSTMFFTVNATDYAGYVSSSDSVELTIDTSPPAPGSVTILNNLQRNQFINHELASFRFKGFSDPHSGIDYFNIGVGTNEGMTDIVSGRKIYTDYLDLNLTDLIDGHPYFIVVQAVNHAGLISRLVSKRFVLDRSIPNGGHVLDGIKGKQDIDFQSSTDVIHAHWKNFDDPESGLAFYKVGLGTDRYVADIRPMVVFGMMTDVFWNGPFTPGQKYFVTVEACNKADLCTRRCSDGIIVDNSPPIRGLVRVGPGDGHSKYLGHRSYIQINWQGFEDPQSGIDHYEVCVSTPNEYCDVLHRSNNLLHSSIIKSNITLPRNTELVATVWAFNQVGINVSKTCDIFVVDDSPPVVRKSPTFLVTYNSAHGKLSQWEKSIIRLEWEFADDISPIVRHEISLKTHHEGHTPVEHFILGSERHVTVSLDGKNWLNDGDKYYAVVTSCNAAGLCSSDRTPDLLIDSTPPHLGGFKPPMTWTHFNDSNGNIYTNVTLTWYGFHDQESGIEQFYITVSRFYGLDELSTGVITFPNSNQSEEIRSSITLSEKLLADDRIVLSIWAQNNVGLNSSISRITVTVISSTTSSGYGILEIEKHSCDVHFCNKDCTCAAIGRPCVDVSTNLTCSNMSPEEAFAQNLPVFNVYAGLPHEVLNTSASSACLSGHWSRTDGGIVSQNIRRFEWSIGIFNQSVGYGIYDLQLENPWTDIGLRSEFIHCLPINRTFINETEYVVYVRAWYEANEYALFESSPIMIDRTGPSVRRGRYIREGKCIQDLDFIEWTDSIIACWDGVFNEPQSRIDHFSVSVGTSPHSDDVLHQQDVGLATNISLDNLSLSIGTRYYITVVTVNTVGLHTALVSDGFVIDTDNPIDGVVFNTKHHKNTAFQRSTNTFEMSWHGFQDHYSGIKYYMVAISNVKEYNSKNISFTNVGLLTAYTFTNQNLKHGESYSGIVKAVDAAGHESVAVLSPAQLVDETPPKGFNCESTQQLSVDISYKVNNGDHAVVVNATFIKDNVYYISGTIRSLKYDLYPVLTIDRFSVPLPFEKQNGGALRYYYTFISQVTGVQSIEIAFGTTVEDEMLQHLNVEECTLLSTNNSNAISTKQIGPYSVAVSLLIMDAESEIRTVSLGAGTTKGRLQIKALNQIHHTNNVGVICAPFEHGMSLYVTAIAENHAGLKTVFHSNQAIIIDHTSPILHDIDVSVAVHRNSSITLHATWKVKDDETDVLFCKYSVGSATLTGDIQAETDSDTLQSFQSGLNNLHHGDIVYVTVICVNNVELATTLVSSPLTIYLDPPISAQAFVHFMPVSQESTSPIDPLFSEPAWQSNASMLQLEWINFEDRSLITSYRYRIHSNGKIVVDWMDAGFKDTISNLNLKLMSGQTYTAEVKAVNGGYFNSSSVQSSLVLVSEPPALSGQPVAAVFEQGTLKLNWKDVFNTFHGVPHHYSLVVGSRDGFSDVAEVIYTRDHVYDVIVPSSTFVSPDLNEMYIKITCTYSTGLFSIYSTSYKL